MPCSPLMSEHEAPANPAKPRVLFADSSRLMRRSAERILGQDYSLVLAESLEQAWISIQDDPLIQVVFCDLLGSDGNADLSLVEHVRNAPNRRIRETPIVLMIDDDAEENLREQALKLGVSDFIDKPFRPSELQARARAHATTSESIQRLRQLEQQHNRDQETGLGNRRYFFERLAQSLSFARRHQQALSLVHVHLEGLEEARQRLDSESIAKRVSELGRALAAAIRHEDTVYRTGPETFSFILPGTGADGAETVRCRLAPELDALGLLEGSSGLKVAARFIVQSPNLDPEEPLLQTVRDIRGSMGELQMKADPLAPGPAPATTNDLDELIDLARRGDHAALQRRLPEVLDRLRPLLELAGELEQMGRDSKGD